MPKNRRKKKATWKTVSDPSTKHFARIRPQITRILFRIFEKLVSQKTIVDFSFKTVYSYEDRRIKKRFTFRMHGIKFCVQFVPSRRSIVDHENNDSRFLVIALPQRATVKDIEDVVLRDIATWDIGFGLEKLVENAFSPENRPKWCKFYKKGTHRQDKQEGIDCRIRIKGGPGNIRGELLINVKQRQKNFMSDHGDHSKKFPGVVVLDLPYPAGLEIVHQGVYEIAAIHLRSKRKIPK